MTTTSDTGARWVWIPVPQEGHWGAGIDVTVDASEVAGVQARVSEDEVEGFVVELHTRGGGVILLWWSGEKSDAKFEEMLKVRAEACRALGIPVPGEPLPLVAQTATGLGADMEALVQLVMTNRRLALLTAMSSMVTSNTQPQARPYLENAIAAAVLEEIQQSIDPSTPMGASTIELFELVMAANHVDPERWRAVLAKDEQEGDET